MSEMKKILLFFWNTFFVLKKHIVDFLYGIHDRIFVIFKSAPHVMTSEETVRYILENKCSVTRYGDAEIRVAYGTDVRYQVATEEIQKRLREVLGSDSDNLLVCLPAVFDKNQLSVLDDSNALFWKEHLARYRKYWYKELKPEKIYGNAFISRHYMNLRDKSTGCREYFELVKKIWENENVIIVEGEKSRLGMGNDLFSRAKSVRRILGPSTQCFSKYDELLRETKSHGRDALYILALGPSASIMAYDLAKEGYRAIDMGNIDTEYEWFLAGAKDKQPVKNKLVYEAMRGTVGEADDPEYLNQIIAKIL